VGAGPAAAGRVGADAPFAGDRPGVLLVGNFHSSRAGVHSVCEDLRVRLAESGWPVVAASARTGRLPRLADMLATAWRERRHYAVAQVDLFSGPAFVWAECVCALLDMAGKPYVLTLHGGNLPQFAARWPGRVARLLAAAAAVTAPSRHLALAMDRHRSGIEVIPNPIDLGRYEFRQRLRVRPKLVWLRSFHAIYNPTLAVAAVARLSKEWPATELVMTGPDRGDGTLEAVRTAAARLRGPARVELTGPVPKHEVAARLNAGDVFLNTSDVDNAPVALLEAMACGLCVVSTDVGGIRHLAADGRNALLVPPRDPEAMAAAVRRLLTEPELAPALSRAARLHAETFDWSAVLPRWQRLLAGTARGGRR
jgi:glycosyltransferase involved in cell wall biosynthesis